MADITRLVCGKSGRPSQAYNILVFLLFSPSVVKPHWVYANRYEFITGDAIVPLNLSSNMFYKHLETLYDEGYLTWLQITRNHVELGFSETIFDDKKV